MKYTKTTAIPVHNPNPWLQWWPRPSPSLQTPGPAIVAGSVLCLLLSAFGAGAQTPAISADIFGDHFTCLGHSPEIGFKKAEEGVAADGTNYFLTYRRSIVKVDSTWTNILSSNNKPFSGLKGFDHLGAAEYHDGKLYVAAESYHGCGLVTNQSICVYNAADLSRISTTCISNFTTEISAVTIVPGAGSNGTVFVSNFCDGAQLYKFDLSNLSYLGALPLDTTIPKIQGLAYHDGLIYAVADSGTNGVVYDVDPRSGHVRKTAFLSFPKGKEVEGCSYTTGNFLILVAGQSNYVYSFSLTR